ncbi:histidine kinase [Myroides sp. DF42-4-2]|uniref:histidine kinase n=1 Tax=unclassified Myroides TaxID=2642485 RepID=UPI00257513B5|nr:histidine kinase [Myroides sp. DF42-4-2]MDM1408716.1 histidine kinase [Myroides sp. DF42-4-2]
MKKLLLSRRTLLSIAIAIVSITSVAILFLSNSINSSYEETYQDIIKKSFNHRKNALEEEFKKFDNQLHLLADLVQETPLDQLQFKYNVVNEIQPYNSIPSYNWYIVIDSTQHIEEHNLSPDSVMPLETPFVQQLIHHQPLTNTNTFIQLHQDLYWVIWTYIEREHKRILTGFTFDLNELHKHLTTIDITTPNYAYIFAADGTCIYHPEISLIGKNVFEVSSTTSRDTTTHKNNKSLPQVVQSEFLNLEVYRFFTAFNVASFKGYISINFPKVNVDENVIPLKRNTYLIFISSISIILLLLYFYNLESKRAYKEKEELEKLTKEKALIQLKQLKNQINPHFLFNSLNSLYMLITIDSDLAQQFTLDLSQTYRYLIHSPNSNLVELDDELKFIEQYIALHRIRFPKELHFEVIDKRQAPTLTKIPYLALQIAVENAMKHNIATIETPLLIQVTLTNEYATVINNIQLKEQKEESEGFGLFYIASIYQYYQIDTFETYSHNETFTCIFPLINC